MAVLTSIQLRRGTTAEWSAANPVLASAEPGYDSTAKKFKLGDGVSAWSVLPFVGADAALEDHTHPASEISDSTTTGRALITATDAAAARSAIGAGTSSLVIGTGAGNAKAGNWVPSFAEVSGTISTAQLPPIAINDTFPVTSQAAMLALTAQRGDVAIRSDVDKSFILSTESPGTLADWLEILSTSDVTSVAGRTGAVTLTKSDVGLANVDNTSDANKPISSATQTALNAKEGSFGAGTTAQVLRGDKTWVTADKALVGLGNVDNTSDANKPISSATQTALNGKEATIAAGTTAQYRRGDKTWQTLDKTAVGLANVDNTTDANKPISSATQTALNAKAPLASPAFTGTPTGITKTHVGLANVDNTSDANKPVSSATQTALNAKANSTHTHNSADILTIDGGTP